MKQRGAFIDKVAIVFFLAVIVVSIYFFLVGFGVITGHDVVGSSTAKIYVVDRNTAVAITTATVTTNQGGMIYTGVFDGNLYYVFSNIPAGSYFFSVSAPGYISGDTASYLIADLQTIVGSILLTQGTTLTSQCVDTDSGKTPKIKGTVTVGQQTWEDVCSSSTVVEEHYCYIQPTWHQSDQMPCADGEVCNAGACGSGGQQTSGAAYWKFDELSWSAGSASVIDSIGSSSAAPQGGVTTVGQGVGGRAGYFDGSDDFVENTGYTVTSGGVTSGGPVTASFWLRVNASEVKDAGIFGVGSGGGANRFGAYLWANNKLYWDYGEPSDSTGRLSIDYSSYYGNWTHVALVSGGNGGTVKAIYINGKQIASASVSDGPDALISGLTLGMSKDVFNGNVRTHYLKGMLDEINISYRVASADEIKAIYEKQRKELLSVGGLGRVAHWSFDEIISADAGAVKDALGGIGGSAKNGVASISGRVGRAASFDGSDDELVVPNTTVLSFYGPFSVSGWFKTNNLTAGNTTASWVSKRNAYVFGPNKDGSVDFWAFLNGGWGVPVSAPAESVKTGVWQYWNAVYNGSHIILYLNGSEVKNTPVSGAMGASGDLYIGRDFTGGAEKRFFNGGIDELQFFDYGLSATAVDSLFKAQLAVAAATPVPPTSVSACGTIDKSGIYQLTQSLSSDKTCLTIASDNVSLDGQGNAVKVTTTSADPLASSSPDTTGISVRDKKNVTLKNIKVEGFTKGILLHNAQGAVLDSVSISQSEEVGLYLNDTRGAFINRGAIEQSLGSGVWFQRSNFNTMDRVAIRSNANYGVLFVSSSDNSLLRMTFFNNGLGNYQNDSASKNNTITLAGSDDTPPPPIPLVIQPDKLAKGYNTTLNIGETLLFRVGTTNYNMTIVSLNTNRLTITIKNLPITFTLSQGETQSLDLNANSLPDFNITFIQVTNGKPLIMLRTITEPAVPAGGNISNPGGGTSPGSGIITRMNTTNSTGLGDKSWGVQWDSKAMIIVIVALIIFIIFVIVAIVYTVKQQNTNKNNEFYRPEPHSSTLQPGSGSPSGF